MSLQKLNWIDFDILTLFVSCCQCFLSFLTSLATVQNASPQNYPLLFYDGSSVHFPTVYVWILVICAFSCLTSENLLRLQLFALTMEWLGLFFLGFPVGFQYIWTRALYFITLHLIDELDAFGMQHRDFVFVKVIQELRSNNHTYKEQNAFLYDKFIRNKRATQILRIPEEELTLEQLIGVGSLGEV